MRRPPARRVRARIARRESAPRPSLPDRPVRQTPAIAGRSSAAATRSALAAAWRHRVMAGSRRSPVHATARHRRPGPAAVTVTVGIWAGTGATAARAVSMSGSLPAASTASRCSASCRLAGMHRGEMQQPDVNPAGLARIELPVEHLPGAAEHRAREQRFAEYRMAERLRLLDQRADQVTIVDDPLPRPVAP